MNVGCAVLTQVFFIFFNEKCQQLQYLAFYFTLAIKLDYYSSVSLLQLHISYEAKNYFDVLMAEYIVIPRREHMALIWLISWIFCN